MFGKIAYEHFIPEVPLNKEYGSNFNRVLVSSLSDIELPKDKYFMAWDTETSGLNPLKSFIVGCSFTFDGLTSYYLPVKHMNRKCFGQEGLSFFFDLLMKADCTLLYNCRFDMRMMEYAGFDLSTLKYADVMINTWLADTNVPMPSLKKSARRFLGWEMTTFEEMLGEETNAYYTTPEQIYQYACDDALATWHLGLATLRFYKEAGFSGKCLQQVMYPLMKFEDSPVRVSKEHFETLSAQTLKRIEALKDGIYQRFGFPFDLNSGKQLSSALSSKGYINQYFVKSGYLKTDIANMKRLKTEFQDEVFDLIVEYKELFKAYNSYQKTILAHLQEMQSMRFNYLVQRAPTTRLASGTDRKNDYFSRINVQSIPQPARINWFVHNLNTITDVRENEVVVENYLFSTDRESARVIEGPSPELNVRKGFLPEEDSYWVTIDFSAEELRLPAVLSGETTWLNAFKSGEDIHKATALKIWGTENYNKEYRRRAKVASFSQLYGGNWRTLSEKLEISVDEAQALEQDFKKGLPTLFNWISRCNRKAKREGSVHTYFGLPRRVRYYLNNPESRIRAFGYRTVTNAQIQGLGADILRIALLRLWKNVLNNPTYRDDARFLITVHDEVNFSVRKNRLTEILPLLVQSMEIQPKGWPIKMEVGIEVGTSWGSMFGFSLVDNKLLPKWEEKREEIAEERINYLEDIYVIENEDY